MNIDSEREQSSDPNLLMSSDNCTFHDDEEDDDDSSAPEYGEDVKDLRDVDCGAISDIEDYGDSDEDDVDDDDGEDDFGSNSARGERSCLLVTDTKKVKINRRSSCKQRVKRRPQYSHEWAEKIPLNPNKLRNNKKRAKQVSKDSSEEEEDSEKVPLNQRKNDERPHEYEEHALELFTNHDEVAESQLEVHTVQVIKIIGNLGDSSEQEDIDEPFKSLESPIDNIKTTNETTLALSENNVTKSELVVNRSNISSDAVQVSEEIDAKCEEHIVALDELPDCDVEIPVLPTTSHAIHNIHGEVVEELTTKLDKQIVKVESATIETTEKSEKNDYLPKESTEPEQDPEPDPGANVNVSIDDERGKNTRDGACSSAQCLDTAAEQSAHIASHTTATAASVLEDEESWRDSVRESIECYYSAQDLLEYGHLLSSGLKTPDIESGYFEKSESDISRDENEVYTNNLSNRIRQRSFSKSNNIQLTNMSESLRFELNRFKSMIESIERERIYGQSTNARQDTFDSVLRAEESYNDDMDAEVAETAETVAKAVSITVTESEDAEATRAMAMDVDEEDNMDVEGAVGGDDDTRGYWSTIFGQASQIEETAPEMTLDERFADIQKAHRALELLEDYHSRLSEPQDRALRIAIERVIRIFKSRLFQALLDIQEFYELTLLDDSKTIQQKTAETLQIASKWEQDGHAIKIADNQRMKVDGDTEISKESAGVSASGAAASESGSGGAVKAARSPEAAAYHNRQKQQSSANVDTASSEAVSANVYSNNNNNNMHNNKTSNSSVSSSIVCESPIYHFNCLQMGN